MRTDVYQKITDQIVTAEAMHQPWNVEHSAGRITRPLRGNGVAYQDINVVMLWSAAIANAAPIWMTFKQALELNAHVPKGEHGSLVVHADKIIRTETDNETEEEAKRDVLFLKGYTVFNAEQIEGLPAHYYAKPEARTDSVQRIACADAFFAATGANVVHGAVVPVICLRPTTSICRASIFSATRRAITRRAATRPFTGLAIKPPEPRLWQQALRRRRLRHGGACRRARRGVPVG
jgi:antirestriction protein ArdC